MITAPFRVPLAIAAAALGLASAAAAQEIGNPADKLAGAHRDSAVAHPPGIAQRVWEMPAIEVQGRRLSRLREEHLIGAYSQPRWTAHRRFSTTRVYVVPQGFVEFEYWLAPKFPRHGDTEMTTQYELELGLPGRVQLDFYVVAHKTGGEGALAFDEQKAEVRWAFADWNVIPANPTLYLEWIAIGGAPDHVEGKLLLGGSAGTGWHWGTNLVFEHETGGAQENSNELTAGLSRTLRDQRASIGVETKLAFVDVKGSRGDYEREMLLGPSFQVYPLPWMHVDLIPLFGLNDDSPRAQATLILGWEF